MKLKLLIIFLGFTLISSSQNLEQIGKVPLVKINGGVSANSIYYDGSANRDPFTYFINGNLNFNISGIYNIPLSFSYTNQDFGYSTPFKINRLSIHPSYKWVATHIGDVSMTFSPYTVSGHQFTGFVVVATITHPVCVGNCDGSIALVVNEGIGTFTYLWNTGEITNEITNLCAGTYTVVIEGFGNRTLERSYTLVDPQPLIIDLGEDKILCKDQQYTINTSIADPLATYQWQADNGFTANTPVVTLSQSGNYTLLVTTQAGCISTDTIKIITLQKQIKAEFVVATDLFINESFTIVDVSNPLPFTVEWTIPDSAEVIESTREYAEIKFTETGNFDITIVITNATGCQESYTKNITIRKRVFKDETEGKEKLKTYKIFPNPTQGNFTAELTFKEQTPIDMKLFSVTNNSVLYRYQDDNALEYNIPFNLQGSLPSGIYFLLLEIPGKNYVRKIVVE